MLGRLSCVRHIAIAAMGMGIAMGAQAQTRVSINGLVADSVQVFSQDAMDAYAIKSVTVSARGNTAGSGDTFRLPITEIYLGNSKYVGIGGGIVKGGAVGSALDISCLSDVTGQRIGLTLANFRIDYHRKLVMADVTPHGGQTITNQAVYTYKVRRAMAIEADASGKLVLDERLVGLRMTTNMVKQMTQSLELDEISVVVVESIELGELKQKLDIAFRPLVSDKPYTAQ